MRDVFPVLEEFILCARHSLLTRNGDCLGGQWLWRCLSTWLSIGDPGLMGLITERQVLLAGLPQEGDFQESWDNSQLFLVSLHP